jgi:hypothetical protein
MIGAWLNPYTKDIITLCIRMEKERTLKLYHIETPPLKGDKISIDEAKKQGLEENHYTLDCFQCDELVIIRDAINKYLMENK